ncbi:MAG: gamma-glutamyltransferase, partial [Streptomyces sp.]|uniref:gamma-glutamyltransferase n=1 Tax=Streptomyces sp. TaxID=1931 RepID=UPI003D6A3551
VGEQASRELRPGSPGGRTPRLAAHATAVAEGRPGFDPLGTVAGAGEPTVARNGATSGDTCHLDVVDRWGNMVSATPSGGWLHSNPVVPELGFPLGTRLQMTWLDPGLPNTLTPGRRPRTTLTPSLALRDGQPVLAFGTPGGDQQDQWQLHFFLAAALRPRVRGGLDLQGAIDAPNWHTDSFPGSFYPRAMRPGSVTVESRAGEAVLDGLRRRGHEVEAGPAWSEGRLCAVARDPETGVLSAAANPRGMQGYAVGR